MNKTIEFLINDKDIGDRVDVYLSRKLKNLTRSNIKRLINKNNLKINKKYVSSASVKVKLGDKISFLLSEKRNIKIIPKKINLEIIHEDKDILIINKPKGMVVHPGAGNYNNTLANALAYKYKNNLSNLNGELRPGIVHRIDKDTSGLLVIAKNNFSHSRLGEQFKSHSIKRTYQCLIWGVIRPLNDRIETLISRNKKNRQLMSVSEFHGKKAITNYKTIKIYTIKDIPKISLIECKLETGRTHQIRVHFNYKGAFLIGDKKYGKKIKSFKKINENFLQILKEIKGQILHAQTLEIIHPRSNKRMSFKIDPPDDFKKMLSLLNKLSG